MKQSVLVTGGAGFIGSHLIDSLLRDGNQVLAIDNFDPFYDKRIKERNMSRHAHSDDYSFVEADIRNRGEVDRIFEQYQPDIVVHLAAKAGVRPSVADPQLYADVNITGTVNILDAAVKYHSQRVVFASSSSVYGLNEKVPFSEDDPILQPASPYGATKVAGEALCNSYSNCYGLPIVALRFFTVYGPRQRPDLAIHKFVKKILQDEPISLYGDGTTSRDYTYIDDIVIGVRKAMEYEVNGYDVFNLGNDQPTKLIDLVHTIEEVLGQKAKIDWLPVQTGDVPQTWADLRKAERLLGYRPTTHLSDGIAKFKVWMEESLYEKELFR